MYRYNHKRLVIVAKAQAIGRLVISMMLEFVSVTMRVACRTLESALTSQSIAVISRQNALRARSLGASAGGDDRANQATAVSP